MPTIGEVYNPIIEARGDPQEFERLLRAAGKRIFEENPGRCPNAKDGYRAACNNLEYYVQYFDEAVADEVKELLGRQGTFMTLAGTRIGDPCAGAAVPKP